MDGLSISSIWKLLTWLPKFVLSRIFTKEKLRDLILLDVRPRYEYARVNLGEVASFELWLQITNISPFEVEIDRASFDLQCSGVSLKSNILERIPVSSGETKVLHVKGSMSDGEANHIARSMDNHNSFLEGIMEFNCKLHGFSKNNWHLAGVLPRFVDANQRLPNLVAEGQPPQRPACESAQNVS